MSDDQNRDAQDSSAAPEGAFKFLVSKVRHDLRSPLGHILGFAEMLLEGFGEEERPEARAALNDVIRLANSLIGEVNRDLDWANLNAEGPELEQLKENLSRGANRIADSTESVLQGGGTPLSDEEVEDLQRVSASAQHLRDLAVSLIPQLRPGDKEADEASVETSRFDEAISITPDILARRMVDLQSHNQVPRDEVVLLVDDLDGNRELLRRRLSRLGYHVAMASNGQEALDYLQERPVDVILLDIMMPVLDGFQTLIRLKESPETRPIPVIMLSQADEIDIVVYCIKLGADDFLPQPIHTTLLLARLESALAKKRLREIEQQGSSFYCDQGTMRPDSPSYVVRQADRDLIESLLAGNFCYVLTSRQMGKSSLMVRTAFELREKGVTAAVLDLAAIGQNLTPEQWYDGMAMRIACQLHLEDEFEDYWLKKTKLGPVQRFFTALRELIQKHHDRPIVIFVDELDTVRSLPFSTAEFFAAMRESHNARLDDENNLQLSFCLLGVATPTDLIDDMTVAPFNIGTRIELADFSPIEARPFLNGLMRPRPEAEQLLERILYWTHGHPYLTQRLCRMVSGRAGVGSSEDVDQVCHELFLTREAQAKDDNLLFVQRMLLGDEAKRDAVLKLFRELVEQGELSDSQSEVLVDRLRLAGVVRRERGKLRIRNRIYQSVFDSEWVASQL